MTRRAFPFDAVVGQDDAKLALRLAALDPLIGGVLLRGQKGSAKTTLARGLAALLGDAPFVDLPLGATEDRVVGTLDTRAALTGGEIRFEPGLLARAHGGVLYVDEINLLPDHLVDVLLDVAVSGENVVERDGVSHRHPARFVLVGSMNPEEGELRPQLLDRLGLCVEVAAPCELGDRVESVRRRLAFDADQAPTGDAVGDGSSHAGATVGDESSRAGPVVGDRSSPAGAAVGDGSSRAEAAARAIPPAPTPADGPLGAGGDGRAAVAEEVMEAASRLALAISAEGLRADLTLCRAATALARLDGRTGATVADLRRVAPLVLAHRCRQGPFDPPVVPPHEIERALRDALDQHDQDRRAPGESPRHDAPEGDGHDHPRDEADTGSDPGSGAEPDAGSGAEPGAEPDAGSGADAGPNAGSRDRASAPERPFAIGAARRPPLPPSPAPAAAPSSVSQGRVVGDEPAGPTDRIAVLPSLRAAARRLADAAPPAGESGQTWENGRPDGSGRIEQTRQTAQTRRIDEGDLRTAVRAAAPTRAIVLCVDLSGSMGAPARAAAASGTVLGLLADAYERRHKVGLVIFRGESATTVLSPTRSVEVARNRLDDLATGGGTPLAAGLAEALRTASRAAREADSTLLVVLTDGRATGAGGLDRALEVASEVRRSPVETLVLDCETAASPLGLAARLAEAMGGRHVRVSDLAPAALARTIQTAAPR